MAKTVGAKIREARKRRGVSAEWLGKQVGCSQSAISQFERDVREPNPRMLYKIANALQCTVYSLTTDDYYRNELIADIMEYPIFGAKPEVELYEITNEEYTRFSSSFEKLNEEGRKRLFEYLEEIIYIKHYQIAPDDV